MDRRPGVIIQPLNTLVLQTGVFNASFDLNLGAAGNFLPIETVLMNAAAPVAGRRHTLIHNFSIPLLLW
jgi:hypothetical protein